MIVKVMEVTLPDELDESGVKVDIFVELVTFLSYTGKKGKALLKYYHSITGKKTFDRESVLIFLDSCSKSIQELNKAEDIESFIKEDIPKLRALFKKRGITQQTRKLDCDAEGMKRDLYNSAVLIIETLRKYPNITYANSDHLAEIARVLLELLCLDNKVDDLFVSNRIRHALETTSKNQHFSC